MTFATTQGAIVEVTSKLARIPMPPKQAGDFIQFFIRADRAPSGFSESELKLAIDGVLYVYEKYVASTSTTSSSFPITFPTATTVKAFCQVLHAG